MPILPDYQDPSLLLEPRPSWDRNGGLWVTEGTLRGNHSRKPGEGIEKLVRIPANINVICEPLMGGSHRRSDGTVYATYPPLTQRLSIYREALEAVLVFGYRTDHILALALFRRQVTRRGGVPYDYFFFECMTRSAEDLDRDQAVCLWSDLVARMPDRAPIRSWCLRRAEGLSLIHI